MIVLLACPDKVTPVTQIFIGTIYTICQIVKMEREKEERKKRGRGRKEREEKSSITNV